MRKTELEVKIQIQLLFLLILIIQRGNYTQIFNSNTTLVSINLLMMMFHLNLQVNSNTTLVSINQYIICNTFNPATIQIQLLFLLIIGGWSINSLTVIIQIQLLFLLIALKKEINKQCSTIQIQLLFLLIITVIDLKYGKGVFKYNSCFY